MGGCHGCHNDAELAPCPGRDSSVCKLHLGECGACPRMVDGKVDETLPCIRKILPYPDTAKILGGMEIYDAGEFAEELEAHLRTAGPFHDVAPETMPAGSVFEECQTSMIEDQARRLTVLRTVQQIRSASAPYIEYGQVTRAGTKTKAYQKANYLRIYIPALMGRELGLVPGQRMAFMPYKNGMRVIPLEPHQEVTRWMHSNPTNDSKNSAM